MKTALAAMTIVLACLLLGDSYAQSTSSYQSLSGDSGRNILASLKANDSQLTEAKENDENASLWSWRSAPKGSVLVDGELLTDPFGTWKDFNVTESGIGQVGVDPYYGYPIYAYQIPGTGETKYFYLDPYTGEPFYLDDYAGIDTSASTTMLSSRYTLPQVFR